jgi:glycosyltransferase involved in cell wall biosynthesis
MNVSVVIITKDEFPRLRLSLIALGRQSVRWGSDAELIIVDDGSAVPITAQDLPPLAPPVQIIRHDRSRGRSAARNAGAHAARGRRLLFLDGDVLMSPEAVELHGRLGDDEMGRGEQRHLRGTRFFRDPRSGEPWPGKEARVRSMGNIAPYLVTEEMVAGLPYEKLLERAELAIYPGAAPRKLYEIEMSALRAASAPRAQWMAAAGHNFSIPREAFIAAGGFDAAISINEHRELALRLCRSGMRVVVVEGALSLHLTHREGYRDPLTGEDGWEQAFARRHPAETRVLMRFWRSLAAESDVDPAERVTTLEGVDALLCDAAPVVPGAAAPAARELP